MTSVEPHERRCGNCEHFHLLRSKKGLCLFHSLEVPSVGNDGFSVWRAVDSRDYFPCSTDFNHFGDYSEVSHD
jgi:hypothetical protein